MGSKQRLRYLHVPKWSSPSSENAPWSKRVPDASIGPSWWMAGSKRNVHIFIALSNSVHVPLHTSHNSDLPHTKNNGAPWPGMLAWGDSGTRVRAEIPPHYTILTPKAVWHLETSLGQVDWKRGPSEKRDKPMTGLPNETLPQVSSVYPAYHPPNCLHLGAYLAQCPPTPSWGHLQWVLGSTPATGWGSKPILQSSAQSML